jgi:hypothetical protein
MSEFQASQGPCPAGRPVARFTESGLIARKLSPPVTTGRTGAADFAALLPQSLSKADKIPAATTRIPRRNIALRDIALCLLPLTPAPSRPQAMLVRELIPSLGSEFDETASRATASSARSGRNRCGNSVCQAATSASAIASRIRLPCPGKRRSYPACSRALSSRTATASLPR